MMTKRAGVSLVEVMIASAILSGVVWAAMAVLGSSSKTAANGAIGGDLEQRGRQLVDFCKADFLHAKFTGAAITMGASTYPLGIYSNNTEIRYRVPNAYVAGTLQFGYQSPLPPPNNGIQSNIACFIRFEADTAFRESTAAITPQKLTDWPAPFPPFPALAVQVVNQDINKNGNQTDSFVRGRLRKYTVASTGDPLAVAKGSTLLATEGLSDYVLLRVDPVAASWYNGDVNGDGMADPLFNFVDATGATVTTANVAVNGRGVIITTWHCTLDESQKTLLLRQSQEGIKFRNVQ